MKKTLLLLLALCFSLITSATLPLGRSFVHITSETGLSQSNVKAILQDSYGFMWFGTKNGLNRYDGQRVVQFRCEDPARKRGNQNISALFEDDRRTLWVGTDEGVFLYDPVADSFSFLDAQTEQGEGITGWISTIAKDMEGTVWICAPGQGVFRFDGKKLNKPSGFDNAAQPHHLCVCPNGEVYAVAWYAGLFKYDRSTGRFAQITKDVAGRTLLGLEVNTLSPLDDYLVMSLQNGNLKRYDTRRNLLEDIASPDLSHTFTRFASVLDGDIYAGTYNGLYVVDGKTGAVRHFRQEAADPSGLSDNIVYSAYRDREGGLWIGTMYGGVNYQPRTQFSFRNFRPDDTTCPLSSKRIRELAEDGRGNLWIGTEDAGLDVTIDGSKVAHYPLPLARSKTPVTIVVASFGGKTYCSLYKEGLVVIDEKGRADFYPYSELGVGGTGCSIYALHMDHDGTLWAGSDFGVFRAPKGSLKFTAVPELEGQWIFDIMQEKDGTLWFASMGKGAWKYNPKNHSFKHYVHEVDKPNSLSSNSVSSVMQDSKGRVWLSTDRGGLCRYNQKEDNFTRLSVEEGMPDDVAYKVLEDSLGFLWFGTNRGLVRFNPETEDVRVFTVHDGLCGNQFNYKSAVKGSDGNFYFGSIEGLVCFNPDIRKEPTDVPPIYITRFSVFNEEVTVHSPESPLEQSIIGTKEIVLPHDRANMSFDIALLSYSTQQANEYYYKLEPVDKQWIRTRTENSISYANLPPGNYVLHLRATTDAGMEDTQYASRSLAITILPPWYASVWAYIAYAILAACAFGIWFLWYRRHKNKQFSERQKLFEIEKEKEMNENKVEFFTEIAHEIRTPLTLINGPLEIIQEMHIQDEKLQKNLNVIAINTKRLLNLAAQLLDFQKMGANKLELNYEVVNVSELLQETVNRFEPTFSHQQKVLKVEQFESDIIACIDKEAITKILSNLLNNALKYGNKNIAAGLDRRDGNFSVYVRSDGAKIPKERAEQIFEPFFQGTEKKEKRQGAGIGLALARSLALLHKGTLILDTGQPDNTFVLTIPLNMENITANSVEPLSQADLPLNETMPSEETTKGNVILVVEDEESIRDLMKERLAPLFIVETASNGKEALDIIRKEHIDLVISDVMMPVMDGYGLCSAIKKDINLCHIPIIFLTAKNDIDSKIKGLKAGAEAYIEKPFSYDYLKAQILSLLNNRQKEREAFSKRPFFPVQNMQMSKEDEEFMEKVLGVINANLKDETFNVERMAEELCLSRSSLLRKIKTLFNLSPIDFIRLIRLKKAAELIQEGKYRVGEICYMVGFSSHSYFSKLFFKQFGMTPKDFEKQIASTRSKVRDAQKINIEDFIQDNKKKT